MRFRIGASLGVACAVLLAPLAAQAATPVGPSSVTLSGTYQLLAADTVTPGTSHSEDVYRPLLVVGNKTYTLRLPAAVHLKGGTGLRVTGTVAGRTLTASSVTPVAALNAPHVATTTSTRVLVILAEWNNDPDSETQASAAHQMFTDTAGWYSSASYGAVTQQGDVTPWVHIAGPANEQCYGDAGSVLNQARTAAAARGYNLATYDRTVVYFPYDKAPGSDCAGYAGWAYEPGNVVWLNGYMDRRATVHEQGHNYGLSHAHSYLCSTGALTGGCTFTEYGDDYDAMGGSGYVGQFSAKQKNQLGWLGGTTLTPGTSATLSPIESSSGVRAAVVNVSSSRAYWLEYRQRTGYDTGLPTGATNGVIVHLLDPSISPNDQYYGAIGPNLLDQSPADHTIADTTLKSGQSWTTPEGKTIVVGSVTSGGAVVSVLAGTLHGETSGDFTGDGKTDAAVWRPSTHTWWVNGQSPVAYGAIGDRPVPADYNGDGKTDRAVFRPSTGTWWVSGMAPVLYGASSDITVPGDYTGDRKADIAVYRPSTHTWYVRGQSPVAYGAAGDVPVPADYNGDGKVDIAVYRPSTHTWWVLGQSSVAYGATGDRPVAGDYTGDGKADVAVFRPSTGTWWVRGSAAVAWGAGSDVVLHGDYNGDRKMDLAVWRPSNHIFYVRSISTTSYGAPGDLPQPPFVGVS